MNLFWRQIPEFLSQILLQSKLIIMIILIIGVMNNVLQKFITPCYIVLYSPCYIIVLYYTVFHKTAPCFVTMDCFLLYSIEVSHYSKWCASLLHCNVLRCTIECTILYQTTPHCTRMYCTILNCDASNCTGLYYTISYCTRLQISPCCILHYAVIY